MRLLGVALALIVRVLRGNNGNIITRTVSTKGKAEHSPGFPKSVYDKVSIEPTMFLNDHLGSALCMGVTPTFVPTAGPAKVTTMVMMT
jgi:hypothetical protein